MKRMFTWLLLAVLTVGMSSQAWARMELQQKDDGTASFDHSTRNLNFEVPVGQQILTILQTNVTTAKTSFVTIPITNAKVTYIQAVAQNRLSGAASTFRLWNWDSNGNRGVAEITNGTQSMRLTKAVASGALGTPTGTVFTFTPTGNNTFTQDHVLAIQSEGTGTIVDGNMDVVFTITVRPR